MGKIVLIKFEGYILQVISIVNYDEEKFHSATAHAKETWSEDEDYLTHMLNELGGAGFIFDPVEYDFTDYD